MDQLHVHALSNRTHLRRRPLHRVDDSEDPPFAYKGIVALNGKDKQRVYILPREKILIIRVGPQVRGWNDSYFPNLFANP